MPPKGLVNYSANFALYVAAEKSLLQYVSLYSDLAFFIAEEASFALLITVYGWLFQVMLFGVTVIR